MNDACVLEGKVNVYASIFRFDGQVSVFGHEDGPCYRCLYPDPPPPGMVPSCAEGGVLGVLPGIVGTLQATEVIKVLTDIGTTLSGRLLVFDALDMKFRELRVRKDPECPVCGNHPTVHELIDYHQFCGVPNEEARKAMDAEQHEQDHLPEKITPRELKDRMEKGDKPFLIDLRNANELDICKLDYDKWLPMQEIPERLSELEELKDRELVVY